MIPFCTMSGEPLLPDFKESSSEPEPPAALHNALQLLHDWAWISLCGQQASRPSKPSQAPVQREIYCSRQPKGASSPCMGSFFWANGLLAA